MTQDDIIRMAREAGCIKEDWLEANTRFLERFAALVSAAEREACAKICDVPDECEDWEIYGGEDGRELMNGLAAAIRARGQS